MVINSPQYQHNEQSLFILNNELVEHKKDCDIWRWKSRSYLVSFWPVHNLYGYKTFKYKFCFYQNIVLTSYLMTARPNHAIY